MLRLRPRLLTMKGAAHLTSSTTDAAALSVLSQCQRRGFRRPISLAVSSALLEPTAVTAQILGSSQARECIALAAAASTQRRTNVNSVTGGSAAAHARIVVDLPEGFDASSLDIRETFKHSVQKRTVGNNALRRFLRTLQTNQTDRAIAAIQGSREGGLKIDHDTYEVYMAFLIRGGQLRAAMETYQLMLEEKVCPHTRTFNTLIDLCVEKKTPESAEKLFNEMLKRGRQPDVESYEALMRAYAAENPPRWEQAVAVFDKLQRTKVGISANTYNALMTVYLNMTPFDWRVVYNAYYELRYHKPKIVYGWNSYQLVDEAMRRGKAGRWRRFVTFFDAWCQITVWWSKDFWFGILVMFCCFSVFRMLLGHGMHAVGAVAFDNTGHERLV